MEFSTAKELLQDYKSSLHPPHSPSFSMSPTGWTSSLDEPSSPPPQYHPYCILKDCPQGIHHKKSQGTSPHPQPHAFSLVNSLDLYTPSDEPANTTPTSFSPGHNFSPPPAITDVTPPPTLPGNLNSLLSTLWNPDDPQISILHGVGFTVEACAYPTRLPSWDEVNNY